MVEKILNTIKKIIFSAFLLYGYNLLSATLGLTISINIITILILTILDYPSLFSLILIQLLIY